MSRSLTWVQALVLGIVVLVGVGLATVGLFAVGSRGWYGKQAFQVRAGFASVRGVEVGTRVRVQGIDAGEVIAVEPPDEPGKNVVLRLQLRGEFRSLVRSNATVRIVSEGMIGGKVVEILPGKNLTDAVPLEDNALLASVPTVEIDDVLEEIRSVVAGIRMGEGTLGQLARDGQVYDALLAVIRQGTDTLVSVQRDADSIKRVPIVGGYIEDPTELLVRPRLNRERKWFREGDLFEPGRAVLTDAGKVKLDEIAPWLLGFKQKNTEVVVVTYADPHVFSHAAVARTVTREQSDAVIDYLKTRFSVHKIGWFSSRKIVALGMGVNPAPNLEPEPLPAARVEILVFTPQ